MEFVIGRYVALSFDALSDAPGVHTELKKRGVDAAVVDHAYILSKLQLAAALSRIDPFGSVTASIISSSKQRRTAIEEKAARLIFIALSPTHNLDKVLQELPPGPNTSAVVVIARHEGGQDALAAIREVCTARQRPGAAEGSGGGGSASGSPSTHRSATPPSSTAEDGEVLLSYTLATRADTQKVMQFYSVTESEVRAVRVGFSSQEIAAMEQMAHRCGADASLLLDVKALERCVVNRLATTDV